MIYRGFLKPAARFALTALAITSPRDWDAALDVLHNDLYLEVFAPERNNLP